MDTATSAAYTHTIREDCREAFLTVAEQEEFLDEAIKIS